MFATLTVNTDGGSEMGNRRGNTAHDGAGVIGHQFLWCLRRVWERQVQLPDPTLGILQNTVGTGWQVLWWASDLLSVICSVRVLCMCVCVSVCVCLYISKYTQASLIMKEHHQINSWMKPPFWWWQCSIRNSHPPPSTTTTMQCNFTLTESWISMMIMIVNL